MRTFILGALLLALMAEQSGANLVTNELFEHFTISASDVVGSGYIRFYGAANEDHNSVFSGWFNTGSTTEDPFSENSYPAYDTLETLNLKSSGEADESQLIIADPVGPAYTLLFDFVNTSVCVGDANNPVCADPGIDIPITVSTTLSNDSASPGQ
jgi:hypothetical protein